MISLLKRVFYIVMMTSSLCSMAFGVNIDKSDEIEITSDLLKIDYNQNIATYNGNVKLRQDGFILNCIDMEIYYRSLPKKDDGLSVVTDKSSIEKILFYKDVIITRGNSVAKGDRAKFTYDKNLIELFGNKEGSVSLLENSHYIEGEKIIYNTKTEKFKIVGSSNENSKQNDRKGRVSIILQSKDWKKGSDG